MHKTLWIRDIYYINWLAGFLPSTSSVHLTPLGHPNHRHHHAQAKWPNLTGSNFMTERKIRHMSGSSTLSPSNHGSGKWLYLKGTSSYYVLEAPIFDFHDYGRNCTGLSWVVLFSPPFPECETSENHQDFLIHFLGSWTRKQARNLSSLIYACCLEV